MASTVWKGHLTFGLVSIPVKLFRAARADKVSFRQLHHATHQRVRQALVAESEPEPEHEPVSAPREIGSKAAPQAVPFVAPSGRGGEARAPLRSFPEAVPSARPAEVSRSEIVKGYEYAPDQYVVITPEDLEKITPKTAREMQILEFVKLEEADPIYFETSYYVVPDRGGERPYALLFEAMRRSSYVAVAQFAMHNREHVVLIRPGRTGIVLHTMFYETEIRRDDEYRTDTSQVSPKEIDLALLLVNSLAGPFEPAKYRDAYREKLDALIASRLEGEEIVTEPTAETSSVVNILEALQKSLEASGRKPPASEKEKSATTPGRAARVSKRPAKI